MASDPGEDKVKEMQKSLKAYKDHFTRAIISAERLSKAMTKHEEMVVASCPGGLVPSGVRDPSLESGPGLANKTLFLLIGAISVFL